MAAGPAALALAGCGRQPAASGPAAPSPEAERLLAELPVAYQAADLDNGRLHFNLCRSCHVLAKAGPSAIGPNLYGVFGRQVGRMPGFRYSAALQAQKFGWDAPHLDGWLTSPRGYIPGTRMSFVGIKDAADRRDLIGYLKVASSGGPM